MPRQRCSINSGLRTALCAVWLCRAYSSHRFASSSRRSLRYLVGSPPNRFNSRIGNRHWGCHMNFNKLIAELIGTFTLVAAVLGAALVSFSGIPAGGGGGSGLL